MATAARRDPAEVVGVEETTRRSISVGVPQSSIDRYNDSSYTAQYMDLNCNVTCRSSGAAGLRGGDVREKESEEPLSPPHRGGSEARRHRPGRPARGPARSPPRPQARMAAATLRDPAQVQAVGSVPSQQWTLFL
ncbi:Hypothetical predicted protein [Lynx pardinus]|uniref:Uncharacterized protein n=1 Tax=Lynx pardinus TaxID=191816 RepID=A0A485NIB7_LYNPA|nr:Hypothetical predicted protein [Lynx pardinus]